MLGFCVTTLTRRRLFCALDCKGSLWLKSSTHNSQPVQLLLAGASSASRSGGGTSSSAPSTSSSSSSAAITSSSAARPPLPQTLLWPSQKGCLHHAFAWQPPRQCLQVLHATKPKQVKALTAHRPRQLHTMLAKSARATAKGVSPRVLKVPIQNHISEVTGTTPCDYRLRWMHEGGVRRLTI
eukprot:5224157-Amphidinium_carterae.1